MAINSNLICTKAMRLQLEVVPDNQAIRVSVPVKPQAN